MILQHIYHYCLSTKAYHTMFLQARPKSNAMFLSCNGDSLLSAAHRYHSFHILITQNKD